MELELTDEMILAEIDFFSSGSATYYRQPDTGEVFEVRKGGVKIASRKVLEGATPIDLRTLDAAHRDWLIAVADAIDDAGAAAAPRLRLLN